MNRTRASYATSPSAAVPHPPTLTKLGIIDEIRRHDDLLSLPQALSEIIREIDKPTFTSDSLAKIILKDPALTSRVIKLANSSFYHRLADITTVHQAVQVLGMTTVKCLALSTSVFNAAKIEASAGIDSKKFYAYILSVAAAAEQIAKLAAPKMAEEVFISGLLHEIGTLFFLIHHPEQYHIVLKRMAETGNMIDAEVELFGIDHCEVGFHLAKRWRLSDQICDAIALHHSSANFVPGHSTTNILRLACLLNQDTSSGYLLHMEERLHLISKLSEALSLTKQQVASVSSTLHSLTVGVASYLDIDIGGIEEILTRANTEIWSIYLMLENLFRERQELSQKLLREERTRGAIESKNISIATLSHYVNNATMAIYGRSQIMTQIHDRGDAQKLFDTLPANLDVIEKSIRKIVAVLAEIKEISPIDDVAFYSMSQAMNIDDRISKRMAEDSGDGVPQVIGKSLQ